jgi:3-hydroxybutyryl-CoA dehydratase
MPDATRPGRSIDQLKPGDSASVTRSFSREDIEAFARITGDTNPAHMDDGYIGASGRVGRVAHGILEAGLISAAIGTGLPGPGTIYLSQTLKWLAAVRPEEELTATVTVREMIPERNRVVLDTVVTRDGEPVLTGEALIMPPRA